MPETPQSSPSSSFENALRTLKEYILRLLQRKQSQKNPKPQPSKTPPPQKNALEKLWDKVKKVTASMTGGEQSRDELANEYKNRYDPRNTEFGEASGETPRFAEISPALMGYYPLGEKSAFDHSTNQWHEHQQLSPYSPQIDASKKSHAYAINVKRGLIPIPLAEGAQVDTSTVCHTGRESPIFLRDHNGHLFVRCSESHQQLSFRFYRDQNTTQPGLTTEDSQALIITPVSAKTQAMLAQCHGKTALEKAHIIQTCIIQNKKYSTSVQGTLRDKSNSKNYITNLDASPILECYSANTLFCALMRALGVPTRLIVGHVVQNKSKEGTALLSSNNGHAWSKVWDGQKWIRIDATPTEKENGEKSDQNMDQSDQGEGSSENSGDKEGSGENSGQSDSSGEKKTPSKKSEKPSTPGSERGDRPTGTPEKSPQELLEELIEKVKEESFSKQAEGMKKALEDLEQATSKQEIRKAMDGSGLDGFAKDAIDELGNQEILEQEKKELEKIGESGDESGLKKALEKSLLDENYRKKLEEYAKIIQKQIQEARAKIKTEMERMGFTEAELRLYREYKILERELEPEIRKQIRALENILPATYKTTANDTRRRSGNRLADTSALVAHVVTGDPNVFRRQKTERDPQKINMYETIIIDRSDSMGSFSTQESPLRECVKAAIIRAKVLEHFQVDFSILFFDDTVESVMDFGEKFSDRRRCSVPSKLMRAVQKSGGTNISAPLSHTWSLMKEKRREMGGSHFGNVTFIGDGEPQSGLTGASLTSLINQIRAEKFGVTAYYISGGGQQQTALKQYFGKDGTVVVPDVAALTPAIIASYNTGLRSILSRYSS